MVEFAGHRGRKNGLTGPETQKRGFKIIVVEKKARISIFKMRNVLSTGGLRPDRLKTGVFIKLN